jgi:hypothetical protein
MAMAQDPIPYGEAGGWEVLIDPSLGNGCFLISEFEDGSVVRIGFDRTAGNGYVIAFNEGWGDIVEGQEYPVSFMLDDQQYDGIAMGMSLSGLPGAMITFDNVDFLADLAMRQTMSLSNEGGEVMVIDLTGSAAAIEQTIACQEEQG